MSNLPMVTGDGPARCRIAICLGGNQPRAQQIASALSEHPLLDVVSRPVSLAALIERLRQSPLDLIVVAGHLRGLAESLPTLLQAAPPLLVLARAPELAPGRAMPRVTVLALEATTETIVQTVLALHHGQELPLAARPSPTDRPAMLLPPWMPPEAATPLRAGAGSTVAVLGVGGSGASTVAVEMAACLSRLRPTVLVDLDLLHPSLLLYLGQPIAHNLNTIAQDNPQTPIAWETTLTREITRLPVPLSDLHLINGLPHPEARHLVTPAFIDRLVEALRLRFGQIVLDVGSDLTSADTAARAHRQVVRLADRVVLVVQPDYSASWRLRHLITQLDGELRIPVERLEIIVNGIGDGTTIPRHELVEEFGPIMAWVPFDRHRILTARRQRQPLLLAAPGPAERALGRYARQLAKRLGTIDGERMPGWHRWLRLWRRSPLRPTELTKGSSHVG